MSTSFWARSIAGMILRIKRLNPELNLPKSDIALVVRQDSSGTTYAFTNHLSAISDEWRDRGPGVGTLIDWPGNAMAARGNEGVAGRIKISKGSIGYVEYGMASVLGCRWPGWRTRRASLSSRMVAVAWRRC